MGTFSYFPVLLVSGADVTQTFEESDAVVNDTISSALEFIIPYIPYVGIVLVLFGVLIAVFSVRNKGLRRWGLRIAIFFTIVSFITYVGLILIHDMYCLDYVSDRQVATGGYYYEDVYASTVQKLEENNLSFLFLDEGSWYVDALQCLRILYKDTAFCFAFTSFQVGLLFLLVVKKNKALRHWALVGLCIVIPIAFFVGYRYIVL